MITKKILISKLMFINSAKAPNNIPLKLDFTKLFLLNLSKSIFIRKYFFIFQAPVL